MQAASGTDGFKDAFGSLLMSCRGRWKVAWTAHESLQESEERVSGRVIEDLFEVSTFAIVGFLRPPVARNDRMTTL